ncbi:MAG: hypothetical protein IT384_22825 [Deltaproteobacteria bacterium]|nr:hypothetical protein [Deltaproteobacteria bacterium]
MNEAMPVVTGGGNGCSFAGGGGSVLPEQAIRSETKGSETMGSQTKEARMEV